MKKENMYRSPGPDKTERAEGEGKKQTGKADKTRKAGKS
jgi:hypothetical protein